MILQPLVCPIQFQLLIHTPGPARVWPPRFHACCRLLALLSTYFATALFTDTIHRLYHTVTTFIVQRFYDVHLSYLRSFVC